VHRATLTGRLDVSPEASGGDVQPRDRLVFRIKASQFFAVSVLFGLFFLLWLARDALATYLLGMFLVYMLLPVVHFIESRMPSHGRWVRIRRPVASIGSFVIALVGFALLIGFLLEPVVDETTQLFDDLPAYWQEVQADHQEFTDWYEDAVPQEIQNWIDANLDRIGHALVEGTASLVGWILSTGTTLISGAIALIAVPLFVIYYLIQEPMTEETIRRQLPRSWSDDAIAVFRILNRIMGSYTRGVVLEAAIVGVITGTGYWFIGVDLALPLGVIAFAGEIVPILGPWIAFAISFPVVLATQPHLAIPAVVLFGVIQIIEGWFLAPRIQGGSVEFTSAGTLLILSVGGAVAGALGVVFALPAAAILRALIVYIYNRLDGLQSEDALARLPIFNPQTKSPPAATESTSANA